MIFKLRMNIYLDKKKIKFLKKFRSRERFFTDRNIVGEL